MVQFFMQILPSTMKVPTLCKTYSFFTEPRIDDKRKSFFQLHVPQCRLRAFIQQVVAFDVFAPSTSSNKREFYQNIIVVNGGLRKCAAPCIDGSLSSEQTVQPGCASPQACVCRDPPECSDMNGACTTPMHSSDQIWDCARAYHTSGKLGHCLKHHHFHTLHTRTGP